MMKRLSALLLALACALLLTACGDVDAVFVTTVTTSTASPAVQLEEPSAPAETPEVPDAPVQPVESPAPAEDTPAQSEESAAPAETPEVQDAPQVAEDGWYSSKEDVALYIHLYGHLPDNYVTKEEARELGWTGGSVERWAGEGTAIGGSRFGNYEGLLPEAEGRGYTECDIDTVGSSSRGAKRIIFSNDGLVYYTGDHYESFELLYGEP